jgi:hypothetical protein
VSTSQNGWPALSSTSDKLHTWTIPGGKEGSSRIRLRHGSAGFLLCHFAMWFDKRVEDLQDNYNDGDLDDWGYAYRAVRGYSSTLSNHASGTALDLNATDHPLGVDKTFTPGEVILIHKRLNYYAGCIRWGGDYRGRKDEMHVEIDLPLQACERVARKLLDSPRGERLLEANPGQREVILS